MHSSNDIGPCRQREAAGEVRPQFGQRGRIDGAGNQRDRNATGAGMLGHDEGRLAQQRLRVAAPFAGDRPVGVRERFVQSNQFGHDFRAGLERAAQELQRESQSAGRARAGRFSRPATDRCLGARGETRDRFVEDMHL